MNGYDEKEWGIEIQRCDDGDLLLRQGECGCGDDVAIRLHPCHFSLMAEYLGLMTLEQHENATARSNDRLRLISALIEGHTKPGDPLRIARDAFLGHQGNIAEPPPPDAEQAELILM